jgi:hypothetical protein
MKKAFAVLFVAVMLSSCFFICYVGCNNPVTNYDYTVKEQADFSELLVFRYGSSIVGIDTVDFSVKGHIRVNDMDFGGVAKLPSGGFAFTHHRSASNNAWGNTLYVADRYGNKLNTYEICYSPMTPKIIGSSLLIGSTAFENVGGLKFQVFYTDNFRLRKEFLFGDMVDAWRIASWGDKAYLWDGAWQPSEYSSIVELDLNTLDTVVISAETDFFSGASLTSCRQDSLLYILNILKKDICIYNLNSKSITLTAKVSEYPAIAAMQADRVTHPYYYNGFLYGKFERNDSGGNVVSYLVKLNPITLEYIDHKQLDTPAGYTANSLNFYAGSYFVMQFEQFQSRALVVFYNKETGDKEQEVTIPFAGYY